MRTFYADPATGETYTRPRYVQGELRIIPDGRAVFAGSPTTYSVFRVEDFYESPRGWLVWASGFSVKGRRPTRAAVLAKVCA